jgi:cobaltochelatase CobT
MSGSAANKDSARADEFKRATAATLRSLAETNEVQVAFQPGPSGLTGKRARLPLPTRAPPACRTAVRRATSTTSSSGPASR